MLYIKKSESFLCHIDYYQDYYKDITKGADLTLIFMDELNEVTSSMSYYYRITDKKTTIFIKRQVLLLCHIWFVMFQCYTVRP